MTEKAPGSSSIQEIDISGEQQELPLKNVKKQRSSVHKHFTLEDGKHRCNYCKYSLKVEANSGTGNRRRHLAQHHKSIDLKNESVADHKGAIVEAFAKQASVFCQESLKEKIVRFVVLTNQPFVITEKQAFIDMMCYGRSVVPKIPSADSVKRAIEAMYNSEKNRVITTLQNIPGKISLIVDCWTTRNRIDFLAIIATWIDSEWNSQELVLDLDIINGSHTGRNLAQSLMDVVIEFEIANKILSVTTDNASNMDKMMIEFSRLLKKQ
ncbi:unnamed protein product, partial [Allacma fusca]